MQPSSFQREIARLSAAMRYSPDDSALAAYYQELKSFPDESFAAAVKTAIRSHERFPAISDLRRYAQDFLYRQRLNAPTPKLDKPKAGREKAKTIIQQIRQENGL